MVKIEFNNSLGLTPGEFALGLELFLSEGQKKTPNRENVEYKTELNGKPFNDFGESTFPSARVVQINNGTGETVEIATVKYWGLGDPAKGRIEIESSLDPRALNQGVNLINDAHARREAATSSLERNVALRNRLGLSKETYLNYVGTFFDYSARDAALERAFNSNRFRNIFVSGSFGALLGTIVGAIGAGFGGYETGEALNKTFEITNNLAHFSIDSGLALVTGIAGAATGCALGGLAGLYTGYRVVCFKEKRASKTKS